MKNFYVEFNSPDKKSPVTCLGNSMIGEIRIKDGSSSVKVVDIECVKMPDKLIIKISPNKNIAIGGNIEIINKMDGRNTITTITSGL